MRRWSAVIAPSLAALACSTPQEPPKPPPPPPASTAPVASSAPPAKVEPPKPDPKVGPLVLVSALRGEGQEVSPTQRFAHTASFAVALADFSDPFRDCPIASRSCQLFSMVPRTGARSLDVVPAGLGAPGPVKGAPSRWASLSGGKTHVFALRANPEAETNFDPTVEVNGDIVVDRISADGSVETFVKGHGPALAGAHVLELKDQTLLVAHGTSGAHQLQLVEVRGAEGKRELGARTTLKLAVAMPRFPGGPVGAQRAREVEEAQKIAVWAPYRVVPLVDDAGAETNEWAIVAVTVNPPPPAWPEGKPFKRKAGAKNGCGKASRSLSDASVEKQIRVLRFSERKLVSERVLSSTSKYDHEATPLRAVPLPGLGIEIDGLAHDKDDKPKGARKKAESAHAPTVPGTTGLKMVTGGDAREIVFDAASGEGAFTSYDGEEMLFARFDARGKLVGAPERTSIAQTPLRVGGEWLAVSAASVAFYTGPDKGKNVPHDRGVWPRGWVAHEGKIVFVHEPAPHSIGHFVFDPATKTFGETSVAKRKEQHHVRALRVIVHDGKVKVLEAGASGVFLTSLDGASERVFESADAKTVLLHQAFGGDTVALLGDAKQVTGFWLGAGKSIPLGPPSDEGPTGIGWRGAREMIPNEPGPSFETPALREAVEAGCSIITPVSARSFALGCLTATDAMKPGRSIGLRVLDY